VLYFGLPRIMSLFVQGFAVSNIIVLASLDIIWPDVKSYDMFKCH